MGIDNWINELRLSLGEDIIFTDVHEIESHSCDWWPVAIKARQQNKKLWQPQVIVRPDRVGQVQKVLEFATKNHIPVTPWGLGSGVTGAALATQGGISLDLSALNQVLMLDEESLIIQVQAGMNGLELERLLNQRGYTLNHSPQSLDRSTVGGWISTRATGQFSSRWGGIEGLALSLSVVLASGELISTPIGPRTSSGPDLCALFIGSEGTLGVVVDVTLRFFPLPEFRCFESLAFSNLLDGIQAMRQIMRSGLRPFLVRFYDQDEACYVMRNSTFSANLLLLGFEGPASVALAEYQHALSICKAYNGEQLGEQPAIGWMASRFDFSTIENRLKQVGGYAETIEVADFWGGIYETYQVLKSSLKPYAQDVLGHFSHVYTQGTSLYMILLGQADDDETAQVNLEAIWRTSMCICLERNIILSHHHGIGLARSPFIEEALGSSFSLLVRVKEALDPIGILNPGKLGLL